MNSSSSVPRSTPPEKQPTVARLRRVHHRPVPAPPAGSEDAGYTDWISRWFRQSILIRSRSLPAATRQLIKQLSDTELALYLVTRYRTQRPRPSTRRGIF